MLTEAGLEVEQVERFQRHPVVDDWLARVETPPEDGARVKECVEGDKQDIFIVEMKPSRICMVKSCAGAVRGVHRIGADGADQDRAGLHKTAIGSRRARRARRTR